MIVIGPYGPEQFGEAEVRLPYSLPHNVSIITDPTARLWAILALIRAVIHMHLKFK
jgi:hypothetical protein